MRDSFKASFAQGPYVKDSFKDSFGQEPYVKDSFKDSFDRGSSCKGLFDGQENVLKTSWFYIIC